MKKQKYLMNKHMKKQKYLKKQKYAGVEYDIYTCSDVCCPVPQWAVECRLCGFHIGTFSKREAEYWIRPHIEEEHADAVRGKKRRRDEMQENSNKDSEEGNMAEMKIEGREGVTIAIVQGHIDYAVYIGKADWSVEETARFGMKLPTDVGIGIVREALGFSAIENWPTGEYRR